MRAPLKNALASWAPTIYIVFIIITNQKTPLNNFFLAFLGSSSVVFSHDVLGAAAKPGLGSAFVIFIYYINVA